MEASFHFRQGISHTHYTHFWSELHKNPSKCSRVTERKAERNRERGKEEKKEKERREGGKEEKEKGIRYGKKEMCTF